MKRFATIAATGLAAVAVIFPSSAAAANEDHEACTAHHPSAQFINDELHDRHDALPEPAPGLVHLVECHVLGGH